MNNDDEESDEDEEELLPIIRIIGEVRRQFQRLGVERLTLKLQFLNPPQNRIENNNINEYNRILSGWLHRAFTALLSTANTRLNIRPSDKVAIKFVRSENDSFSLSFRRFDQYSPSLIISSISRLLQSNAEFLFDENLVVEVAHIQSDVGYGQIYGLQGCSLEKFVKAHPKTVFLVKPLMGKENLCLAYALILAIAHAEGNKNEFNKLMYPPNIDYFTQQALHLCENAKVDLSYGGGVEELSQFQKYFQNKYNIIVFTDRKGRTILFRGSKDDSIRKIYLLLENRHFVLITSIHSAFSVYYYCDQCLKSANTKFCHRDCPYTCMQCYSKPPCFKTENKLYCNNCNRSFYGLHCYSKHNTNRVCEKYKVCTLCFSPYTVKKIVNMYAESNIVTFVSVRELYHMIALYHLYLLRTTMKKMIRKKSMRS